MDQYLILAQKCHDLVSFSRVAVRQFPNAERFALTKEIMESARAMHRLAIKIGKKRFKKNTLYELDEELEVFRSCMYDAHQYGYINSKKYEAWSHIVAEIGRITGGWISRIESKEAAERNKAIARQS